MRPRDLVPVFGALPTINRLIICHLEGRQRGLGACSGTMVRGARKRAAVNYAEPGNKIEG